MPRLRLSFPTGFPAADAENDFVRARRARMLELLMARLRGEPSDVTVILPLDEVVEALGRVRETRVGVRTIPLDAIVGTTDRGDDFDRQFRPRKRRLRRRWERVAEAMRRGESMPPISVYQVGQLYFVEDGHHRVSVARALRLGTIAADVTQIETRLGAERELLLGDLPLKSHERLFRERVPLPRDVLEEIRFADPWSYGVLAENVEAWGFRAMQVRETHLSRHEVAAIWYEEEYRPVVQMLRAAGLVGDDGPAEAYLRVACARYRLLRTHDWSEEIVREVKQRLGD
jgi:hypothetical protein